MEERIAKLEEQLAETTRQLRSARKVAFVGFAIAVAVLVGAVAGAAWLKLGRLRVRSIVADSLVAAGITVPDGEGRVRIVLGLSADESKPVVAVIDKEGSARASLGFDAEGAPTISAYRLLDIEERSIRLRASQSGPAIELGGGVTGLARLEADTETGPALTLIRSSSKIHLGELDAEKKTVGFLAYNDDVRAVIGIEETLGAFCSAASDQGAALLGMGGKSAVPYLRLEYQGRQVWSRSALDK